MNLKLNSVFSPNHFEQDTGPKLLRERGLGQMLSQLGWRVEDIGDLNFESDKHSNGADPHNAKNCALIGHGSKLIADVVEEKLKDGLFPVVLGGDHSIGIGSLTGVLRAHPDIGVIWVDAHADLNTPVSSCLCLVGIILARPAPHNKYCIITHLTMLGHS